MGATARDERVPSRSGTKLIKHFTEGVSQLEKRIREGVRGERMQFGLGVAERFVPGIERRTERAVRRRRLEQLGNRAGFFAQDQFAVTLAFFRRGRAEEEQN